MNARALPLGDLAARVACQAGDRPALRLSYLRRKPGRGLVAVYRHDREAASGHPALYTASVAEAALTGDESTAVTVETFPADRRLPGLAEAMAPEQHPELRAALESVAAGRVASAQGRQVLGVTAEPLRYKPADRCVIRYRVEVAGADGQRASIRVIGKLYREAAEAQAAYQVLLQLAGRPWSAEPLAVVGALVLSEDLGEAGDTPPVRSGLDVVRPQEGAAATAAVEAAATALADLHTLEATSTPLRTAVQEVAKAAKRGTALAGHVPDLADDVRRRTDLVCASLARSCPGPARPAHGSYKPSQLLVTSGSVFLVDFDQFCRADPALDVGYFLAYLRPPGLWYSRPGDREWFEQAAAAFLERYDAGLRERGIDTATRRGILDRCHVFEAALLLKIAARRVNRLQSPRPGEVGAILREIDRCLAPAGRR